MELHEMYNNASAALKNIYGENKFRLNFVGKNLFGHIKPTENELTNFILTPNKNKTDNTSLIFAGSTFSNIVFERVAQRLELSADITALGLAGRSYQFGGTIKNFQTLLQTLQNTTKIPLSREQEEAELSLA